MVANWLVSLIVSVALQVITVVLTPKPKGSKPKAVVQAKDPTAEAGRPIPVLFGTALITETNVLGFWDKQTRQYQVKV